MELIIQNKIRLVTKKFENFQVQFQNNYEINILNELNKVKQENKNFEIDLQQIRQKINQIYTKDQFDEIEKNLNDQVINNQ